jgi:hypothetical protein
VLVSYTHKLIQSPSNILNDAAGCVRWSSNCRRHWQFTISHQQFVTVPSHESAVSTKVELPLQSSCCPLFTLQSFRFTCRSSHPAASIDVAVCSTQCHIFALRVSCVLIRDAAHRQSRACDCVSEANHYHGFGNDVVRRGNEIGDYCVSCYR